MVFHNENGAPYIPLNFRGEWKGSVLLYDALAQSMNVPSLKILDGIGFDAAIDRASVLLGINDPDDKRRVFPRVYPLGLGIIAVSPLQMARAFAVFANQGRDVTPIAIRSVEDRNGRVVLDNERELRQQQRRMGSDIQIITSQNAYVMTTLLQKTVESGTLASGSGWGAKFTFRDAEGNRYRIPSAGKTGTTQNWADAWAVGFTPYYTTAIWFGFDRPGNSLGVTLTGASMAGPVWGDYMSEIHTGLPQKHFIRPASGLTDAAVCTQTGLRPAAGCPRTVTLTFLNGTAPSGVCAVHTGPEASVMVALDDNPMPPLIIDDSNLIRDLKLPVLPADVLSDIERGRQDGQAPEAGEAPQSGYGLELPSYNPLLE